MDDGDVYGSVDNEEGVKVLSLALGVALEVGCSCHKQSNLGKKRKKDQNVIITWITPIGNWLKDKTGN